MTVITSISQTVVEILEVLPPEKQQELLDFAEFLKTRINVKRPRKSLEGIWAHLDINITEEELAETRREMWGNFPKDIEL